MTMIVVAEGQCCGCCALMVANGDDSGCRDLHNHTHPTPMPERIAEGHCVITTDEDEVMCGPCELCGQNFDYFDGWRFAILANEPTEGK